MDSSKSTQTHQDSQKHEFNYKKFGMILKIFVEDPELRKKYKFNYESPETREADSHPDSGFDLFTPEETIFHSNSFGTLLNLKIKCAAYDKHGNPKAFYMFPRSSLSKTPLRLANSVGIIDSGYRGFLMASLDNQSMDNITISSGTRLFQICSSNLKPIIVKFVDSEKELGSTKRGEGGFGSTGYIAN